MVVKKRGVKDVARALRAIDISNMPELLRLVEEVRETEEPRVLRRDSEDVAILMPTKPSSKRKSKAAKTKADYEAFRAAAGGWKDVDTEKLIEDIYADRRVSNRPPVDL